MSDPVDQKPNVFTLVPKNQKAVDPADEQDAEEFLQDFIKAVKDGRVNPKIMAIHFMVEHNHPNTDPFMAHGYWTWQCAPVEHLGMLVIAQSDVIRRANG